MSGRDEKGLAPYWLILNVRLQPPLTVKDDEKGALQCDGYFKNFGITATSEEEAIRMVTAAITDGYIKWDDSEVEVVDPMQLKAWIRKKSGNWKAHGIWFASARALYGDSDEDDTEYDDDAEDTPPS